MRDGGAIIATYYGIAGFGIVYLSCLLLRVATPTFTIQREGDLLPIVSLLWEQNCSVSAQGTHGEDDLLRVQPASQPAPPLFCFSS